MGIIFIMLIATAKQGEEGNYCSVSQAKVLKSISNLNNSIRKLPSALHAISSAKGTLRTSESGKMLIYFNFPHRLSLTHSAKTAILNDRPGCVVFRWLKVTDADGALALTPSRAQFKARAVWEFFSNLWWENIRDRSCTCRTAFGFIHKSSRRRNAECCATCYAFHSFAFQCFNETICFAFQSRAPRAFSSSPNRRKMFSSSFVFLNRNEPVELFNHSTVWRASHSPLSPPS